MRRYFEIYSIMLRNSLIREMSFKANFVLWMLVEVLWFCGQIVFFSIIFGNVDQIGDWSKWEVVLLVGTHQIIAQLFQAFFFQNLANIPELVRTGKLDTLLALPIDSQFAVSSKQFGLDSVINALLGSIVVIVSLANLDITPSVTSVLLYLVAMTVRRRHPLCDHARPRGRQLLDRARAGLDLRLFQLPPGRALS
jgi:ABC-2 type transport system permease protein